MALHTSPCNIFTYADQLNRTVRACSTHGVHVGNHDYQCRVGAELQTLAGQANSEIISLQHQLALLNQLLTPAVRTFLQNLEKLHDQEGKKREPL